MSSTAIITPSSAKEGDEIRDQTIFLKDQWLNLCSDLSLGASLSRDAWQTIVSRYTEKQRFYHTLEHIRTLLEHASRNKTLIDDKHAVDLAIYFHDIIYDPKSKTNEEDSAELFVNLLSPHLDLGLCEKVVQYILATKKHDVCSSEDNDLKLFIDMDMSILGVSAKQYELYARQIRSEYEFVPEADYCKGRVTVLDSFISPATLDTGKDSAEPRAPPLTPVKHIFASDVFRSEYEDQARRNLAWERGILKSGRLV